eukprot:Mrub_05797.p1 GENE.Mrub_05797~~Mrub_05797.p1  ORF type:complete len:250 (-),score=53.49 Mrub_05797:62-811(-)
MSEEDLAPNRMSLQTMKNKYLSAQNGHRLLKKKADALDMKLRAIMLDLMNSKKNMGASFNKAFKSINEANYCVRDLSKQINESLSDHEHSTKTKMQTENVAGVFAPKFVNISERGKNNFSHMFLQQGGIYVKGCQVNFQSLLDELISIGSLTSSYRVIEEANKLTKRRVNALEHVVMPRISFNIEYINSELDELEREEFTRLKKVQDMKKKHKQIEDDYFISLGLKDPKEGGQKQYAVSSNFNVKDFDN